MVLALSFFLALFLAVAIHELGHAFAMRECRVRVLTICLLGSYKPRIRLPIKNRFFPETEFIVTPFIFGGYVHAPSEDMENVSRKDSLYVFGMGPLANILLGLCISLGTVITRGILTKTDVIHVFATILCLLIAIRLTWQFRRFVCSFLLLPVGCASLVFMLYSMQPGHMNSGSTLNGATLLSRHLPIWYPGTTFPEFLFNFAVLSFDISIAIALLNLLPILPLDGGHLLHHALPERSKKLYAQASEPVILILFLLQGIDVFHKFYALILHWIQSNF